MTKAVGIAVNIDDITAYQRELREDYIINRELSNLAGNTALMCGRLLAVASAVLITAKHIDFDSHLKRRNVKNEIPQQSSPGREVMGAVSSVMENH